TTFFTLSLHDALPIYHDVLGVVVQRLQLARAEAESRLLVQHEAGPVRTRVVGVAFDVVLDSVQQALVARNRPAVRLRGNLRNRLPSVVQERHGCGLDAALRIRAPERAQP